jgi:transcriptional regulator with XRE-family HTH domain
MFRKTQDDKANKYIREKIRQARQDAGETQEDLARILEKNRVAISDLERGRVAVNASDLSLIAANYQKPISYFFPPQLSVFKDELSPQEEEVVNLIRQMPLTQQNIAIEYLKKQLEIIQKAEERERLDNFLKR